MILIHISEFPFVTAKAGKDLASEKVLTSTLLKMFLCLLATVYVTGNQPNLLKTTKRIALKYPSRIAPGHHAKLQRLANGSFIRLQVMVYVHI